MLNKKTVDDINAAGKRVLVRCDFNVPVIDGKITDDTRIRAALPTVTKLVNDGARVILCSHMGKPKGQVKEELSLAPVAKRLSELLGKEVVFAKDNEGVGVNARKAVEQMKDGDVILLENTRFRPEEEKNGEDLSKDLASLAQIYVNDAFGTAHRAHSSTAGVTAFVDEAVVGYLMEKEINFLGNAVDDPVRPFAAILGGSKVSSKISVIDNLLEKVDILLIGGGMAYTFIKAAGGNIGKSLVEEDYLEYANNMVSKAKEKGVKIYIPSDVVAADAFANDANTKIMDAGEIEDGWMGLDIGPVSRKEIADIVLKSKTILWNGPMGVFEMEAFTEGTKYVAEAIAEATAKGAYSLIGGGDSVSAIKKYKLGDKVSYVSTGGGAMLEYVEGKTLPGVHALL